MDDGRGRAVLERDPGALFGRIAVERRESKRRVERN